jgi:hypothetical protein
MNRGTAIALAGWGLFLALLSLPVTAVLLAKHRNEEELAVKSAAATTVPVPKGRFTYVAVVIDDNAFTLITDTKTGAEFLYKYHGGIVKLTP